MSEIPERYQPYEPTLTLGCANFKTAWADKPANLASIKAHIGEAARQGINLIAFPELALTGYDCSDDVCMHQELAETIPGPATEEIAALTRQHDIHVVFGMPERDSGNGDVRYIACALIGPDGLIGSYRKLHLGPPPIFRETLCFRGGGSVPVFETRYGPIGIQICADFWMYPELSRIQMLKGARVIMNCSGSPDLSPDRRSYMTQQTGARATENLVYAATANLVGQEKRTAFYGCSTIAGPAFPRFSNIYAQAAGREEIISATLSFSRLHRFRNAVAVEDIRRSKVILEEFMELDSEAARPGASGRAATAS